MNNLLDIRETFLREILQSAQTVPLIRRNGFEHGFISSEEFIRTNYTQQWLVKGILVRGQPAIVGGPKKVLKTSMIVDLAVSLADQSPFLGKFPTECAWRVGVISGESGEATLQQTFSRVCSAKQVCDAAWLDLFWFFRMPQLSNEVELDFLSYEIEKNELDVIILDPLYLGLLAGDTTAQASNIYEMGSRLATLCETCLDAGATPILVHHTKKYKENPFEPPELEDLAFAGVQEFARQWLLIGRREKYEPGSGFHKLWLNVGGSAGHGGCWAVDIEEGQLRDDFGGRKWDVTVRTATNERSTIQEEKKREKQEKVNEDRREILGVLHKYPEGETPNALVPRVKMSRDKIRRICFELESDGLVEEVQLDKAGGNARNRGHQAFRLRRRSDMLRE